MPSQVVKLLEDAVGVDLRAFLNCCSELCDGPPDLAASASTITSSAVNGRTASVTSSIDDFRRPQLGERARRPRYDPVAAEGRGCEAVVCPIFDRNDRILTDTLVSTCK